MSTPRRPSALEAPLVTETPDDAARGRVFPRIPLPPPAIPAQAREAAARGLRRFNTEAPGVVESALLACCGNRRWAARIVEHRPYPDVDALLAAADEASYDMSPADLAEAFADESRVPQPPGLRSPGSPAAETALRAAHAAYESRFGHVFVICLDGLQSDEHLDAVLASLRTRLNHDPDQERPVAADELRKLALVRLVHLVAEHALPTPHPRPTPNT